MFGCPVNRIFEEEKNYQFADPCEGNFLSTQNIGMFDWLDTWTYIVENCIEYDNVCFVSPFVPFPSLNDALPFNLFIPPSSFTVTHTALQWTHTLSHTLHLFLFVPCQFLIAMHNTFLLREQRIMGDCTVWDPWLVSLYEKSNGNWTWSGQLLQTPRPP